jgi:hypothetical protein
MDQESSQSILIKESTQESFNSYIGRPYLGEELRAKLSDANALIIPNEGYGERTDLVYFPSGTSDLYQFLTDRKTKGLRIEVCTEDEDYKELSLHADWLILADFVVKELVAPLVVALIAEYIIEHLGKRETGTTVKSKLIVHADKGERNITYSYQGPASEYRDVMNNAISKLSKFESPSVAPVERKAKRRRRRKKR